MKTHDNMVLAFALFWVFLTLSGVVTSGCASPVDYPEPELSVVDRCVAACEQLGDDPDNLRCGGGITTNLSCEQHCTDHVARAEASGCVEQLETWIDCQETTADYCSECGAARRAFYECEQCETHTYPSINGEIPVCSAMVAFYGCGTFEEMTSVSDLAGFCAGLGDTLTIDQDGAGGPWCYTCD